MYPVLLQIGKLQLYSYGFMIAMGFLTFLHFAQRDARKAGFDADALATMSFWSLGIGVAATRLLHILMVPQAYSWSDPLGWIALWRGGLVFQGAVPAVLIYTIVATRRRKIPFWGLADVVIPWVPLAHAFGRVGCLLYGCCYGRRADGLPWGIRFPEGSPAYQAHFPMGSATHHWSYVVHPTQLYSVIDLLTICVILLFLRKKWHPFTGFTLPVYLVLYGIHRFIVEMFRGDGNPGGFLTDSLTQQQEYAILSVILGMIVFVVLRRRARLKVGDPKPAK